MAWAKRILTIQVNKLFSFYLFRCFPKEIETMFPLFPLSYRNPRESLRELWLWLVFPQHFSFSQTSTCVSIPWQKHSRCFLHLKWRVPGRFVGALPCALLKLFACFFTLFPSLPHYLVGIHGCLSRVWARPRHCANPAMKFKMSRQKMIKGSICPLKRWAIFTRNFTEVFVSKKIMQVEIWCKFDYKRHNFSINTLLLAAELR